MRLIKVCVFFTVLVLAVGVNAEVYKYRDSGGTVRYTDDLSSVPEDQRGDVETSSEIETSPSEDPGAPGGSLQDESGSGNEDKEDDRGEQQMERARELNERQSDLREEYEALQEKRKELEESRPDESASDEEKTAYDEEVRALNERVEKYQEKRKALEKEVDEFNSDSGS